MGTDDRASERARTKKYLGVLLIAGVVGLGVGIAVGRGSRPSVEPLVRDLESAGYVCEPIKKEDDGILNSFSACEKGEGRLEMSTQPTDQAHAEFVRFTIEDMGCSLARSRKQVGFTLYTRDRMVVYEFGTERRFVGYSNSFKKRDVNCANDTA